MTICNQYYNLLALCLLLFLQSSCAQTERDLAGLVNHCPSGEVIRSEDGIRRLALIVGVGQYKSPNIPVLPGPP